MAQAQMKIKFNQVISASQLTLHRPSELGRIRVTIAFVRPQIIYREYFLATNDMTR